MPTWQNVLSEKNAKTFTIYFSNALVCINNYMEQKRIDELKTLVVELEELAKHGYFKPS